MAKTVPVYVSVNAENNTINSQPAVAPADGLVEMWVTPVMQEYIIRNWNKYLVVDGMFKRTVDTLPDLSTDYLIHQNEVLQSQLEASASDLKQAKKDAADALAENKELKSANELTQQGLMEAVDYLSSQLTPAGTTTGTDSTATSSAAPASSAASES
ncbi:hypothetical protein EQG69_04890 [Levilactobacillus brevis]|uniref:hypothetical protein n=1 Tax=Levilactobacillus brevis TaxID=1580 RepID=UPI000FF22EB6|nr:hypothetical protein [Levilactobacillus brevis]RWZ41071.1 hypothetical protein EQG69_04890 [Levilactobacillus brevis]